MSSAGDGTAGDEQGGTSRRTLIRILIGLGIGIPILIEAATFLGLVGQQLSGDDGGGGDETTPTPEPDRVGTGDELLPETPATDTMAAATLLAREDVWKLSITAQVENTTEQSYQFEFGAIHLMGDETVDGGGESDALAPGESTTVTGRWDLPPGSTPLAVDVTGIVGGERTAKTVPLEKIPVQGS
jgi:hypothetical protein